MIRPIMPRITPEITENPLILVNGIVLLALTVLTAVFISLYASNVYKGNKKKAHICNTNSPFSVCAHAFVYNTLTFFDKALSSHLRVRTRNYEKSICISL